MNYYDKRLILFLASPFVAVWALIFVASSVKFETMLYPAEKRLLAFTPESVDIVERHPISVTKAIKSPIEIPTVTTKRGLLASKPSGAAIEKRVSFIFINNGKKITIINGFVLNEGNRFGSSMVLRIEKDRVLIREEGRGKRWLSID